MMKDRIQRILQEKQLTSARLADIIEVQRSSISHILSGRNKPSMDFMEKILNSFPDISGDWLITGKGSMYKNGGGEPPVNQQNPAANSTYKSNLFDNNEPKHAQVHQHNRTKLATPGNEPYEHFPSPKPAKVVKRVVIYYDDNSYDELFLNK